MQSSRGGTVWSCTACTLLHIPAVVEYMKRNPEVPVRELKRFRDRL
ncbi:adenosylcobinamide amidohydrolase [hydrocarbon metagenome]|uniref:Adenosylcobinamide amidohydrolase n=1 Tax=hydrocarbon metagenome TaxID=938273 RepID=A0A0W8FJ86_9ZZZZ